MLPRTEPPRSATRGYNLRSNRHGCHHRDASGRAFQQSQGHLKIVSIGQVEPSDNMPRPAAVAPETYAEYSSNRLELGRSKEIARRTADNSGSYRIALLTMPMSRCARPGQRSVFAASRKYSPCLELDGPRGHGYRYRYALSRIIAIC